MSQERNIRHHARIAIENLTSAAADAQLETESDPLDKGTLESLIKNAKDSVREILLHLESRKGNFHG